MLACTGWQMELEGIEPDGLALNTLILALSGNGQWVSALELFEGVLGAGLPAARYGIRAHPLHMFALDPHDYCFLGPRHHTSYLVVASRSMRLPPSPLS